MTTHVLTYRQRFDRQRESPKSRKNQCLNVDGRPQGETMQTVYAGPKRILRTVLASMASSDDFGPMMHREAQRRRFHESARRAFLGDGLPWNWTIWKRYFPTFIPILDFIHAIHYVFNAAMAAGGRGSGRLGTLCPSYHTLLARTRRRRDSRTDGCLPGRGSTSRRNLRMTIRTNRSPTRCDT